MFSSVDMVDDVDIETQLFPRHSSFHLSWARIRQTARSPQNEETQRSSTIPALAVLRGSEA